ncbi:MAG: hypothetical protein UCL21_03950 [Bacilli bacterium]|nr:hypothetical protein [Bacilli bacterium]
MNLYMDLTTMPSELKEKSFEYELYYNDSTLVKKGNFAAYNASINASGITYASSGVTTLTLFTDRVVNTTTDKYTLYLWLMVKIILILILCKIILYHLIYMLLVRMLL